MNQANLLLGLLLAGLGTTLPGALPAQTPSAITPPLTSLLTHRPHQGLWWNPARDGNYYLISTGPGGLTYVTTNLQIDGKSQSYVLIGQLAEAQGARAVLRSKLYQRVGGSLVPTAGDSLRTEELGDVELRFSTSTTATLILPDGKVEPIETFPLYLSTAASPMGRLQNNYVAAIRTATSDRVSALSLGRASFPIIGPAIQHRCAADSLVIPGLAEFQDLEITSLSQSAPRYQVLDAAQGCRPVGSLQRVDDALELDVPERGVQAVLYVANPSVVPRTANGLSVQAGLYWTPGADGYFWHVALSPDGFAYTSLNAFGPDRRQEYRVLQGPIATELGVAATLMSPIYGVNGGSAPGSRSNLPISVQRLGEAAMRFDNALRANYLVSGSGVRADLEKLILASAAEQRIDASFAQGNWLYLRAGGGKAVRFEESQTKCGQRTGETLLKANDGTDQFLGLSPGAVHVVVYKGDQISTPTPPAILLGCSFSALCVYQCGSVHFTQPYAGSWPPSCPPIRSCGASGIAQYTDVGLEVISNGVASRFYPLPQDWRE